MKNKKKGDNMKKKLIHKLDTLYSGEEKFYVQYFVWGTINNSTQSFYLNPSQLAFFMDEQKLNKSQRKQVCELWGHRGISFDKGFTIERRLTETSAPPKTIFKERA
mgnify:CR=1 FL=1